MANILSFSNWVKSHKTFLTEQVVTTYDSTYDYKKEGDVYYSKKKNTTNWTKASGKAEAAISSKVFKQKSAVTKDVTKSVTKPVTKLATTTTADKVPFSNEEDGNAFRKWVNAVNPGWAKKNQLDPTGSFNNSYILSAWKVWSQGYKAYLADEQEKNNPSLAKKISNKVSSVISSVIGEDYKPTVGHFIIPFVFPEYEPKLDKDSNDDWMEPITKAIFGGSGKKTYGKLGHMGIATISPNGSLSIFEFGRYTGAKKGYGISISKNLGKIAKIEKGTITNFESICKKIKSKTEGDGPNQTMECKLVPIVNVEAANTRAKETTSKKYQAFDASSDDSDANCSTYTIEIAKAGGVPLGSYCFPNPTGVIKQFNKYSIKNVTV